MNIIPLQSSQIEEASIIAAQAFDSDPVFRYLTPDDPEQRFEALRWLTHRLIRYCTQHGHIYTTPDLQGIAAWLPPGEVSSNLFQQIKIVFQLQLYALPLYVGWTRLGRWLKLLYAIETAHQQDLSHAPCWYLGLLVVHPDHQGKGIGSQLLQPILQRASDENQPCYLVTFAEQAAKFYQKNGFHIEDKQQFTPSSPPFWTLQRNP